MNQNIFALLVFEKPLMATLHQFLIGSKLDSDIQVNIVRLAFSGNILSFLDVHSMPDLSKLHVYKEKIKVGHIDKVLDNYTVIVKDLFKKETNLQFFMDKDISILSTGAVGRVAAAFGKSGKVKVMFQKGFYPQQANADANISNSEVHLHYRKFFFSKPFKEFN